MIDYLLAFRAGNCYYPLKQDETEVPQTGNQN